MKDQAICSEIFNRCAGRPLELEVAVTRARRMDDSLLERVPQGRGVGASTASTLCELDAAPSAVRAAS